MFQKLERTKERIIFVPVLDPASEWGEVQIYFGEPLSFGPKVLVEHSQKLTLIFQVIFSS
jgi:hypothetical protein